MAIAILQQYKGKIMCYLITHVPSISNTSLFANKSLKIPNGQAESVNQRRTDNTMAKRKKYKTTNNDLQSILIKLKQLSNTNLNRNRVS